MIFTSNLHQSYAVREEILEGRRYLVAPVIALVEGVHNGCFYPAEEIASFATCWNGVPVPVDHPRGPDGEFVEMNAPATLEAQNVGRLFHAWFDAAEKKLRGEVWVDIEKADRLDRRIVGHLRSAQPLEVSTGLFCEEEQTPGEWQGEAYRAIIRNIRPDHLALLPGGEGACNWRDGCGVRANQKGGPMKDHDAGRIKTLFQALLETVGFKAAEASHEDIRHKLQRVVDAMDVPGFMHFVRHVFDDNFIYEARISDPAQMGMMDGRVQEKLYRRSWSMDAEEKITLGTDIVEVREETNFVPVAQENKTEGPTRPSKEVQDMKDLKTVTTTCLTAHECSHKDGQCSHGGEKKTDEGTPASAASKPETITANVNVPTMQTLDQYIATAPAEMRPTLLRALARDSQAKQKLVVAIQANPRNRFTAEQLAAKDLDELEALAELGRVEVDYTGAGGRANQAFDGVPVLDFGSAFEKKAGPATAA